MAEDVIILQIKLNRKQAEDLIDRVCEVLIEWDVEDILKVIDENEDDV